MLCICSSIRLSYKRGDMKLPGGFRRFSKDWKMSRIIEMVIFTKLPWDTQFWMWIFWKFGQKFGSKRGPFQKYLNTFLKKRTEIIWIKILSIFLIYCTKSSCRLPLAILIIKSRERALWIWICLILFCDDIVL